MFHWPPCLNSFSTGLNWVCFWVSLLLRRGYNVNVQNFLFNSSATWNSRYFLVTPLSVFIALKINLFILFFSTILLSRSFPAQGCNYHIICRYEVCFYFILNCYCWHFHFRTSFEAGQHWNLVVLFCRVHKMELPVSFLQDCAREDKWLPFVCHAQACQFPKEQVFAAV